MIQKPRSKVYSEWMTAACLFAFVVTIVGAFIKPYVVHLFK